MKKILYTFLLLLLSSNVYAALNVFACEPEWAALTQQLAGDKASIYTPRPPPGTGAPQPDRQGA
jgi:zinc/manganese transport system substrate-binding protein